MALHDESGRSLPEQLERSAVTVRALRRQLVSAQGHRASLVRMTVREGTSRREVARLAGLSATAVNNMCAGLTISEPTA